MITIEFEDKGQDFLEWDIDSESGKVVDCRPFQASIWTKFHVALHDQLEVGDKVDICEDPIDYNSTEQYFRTVNYKIISVKEV